MHSINIINDHLISALTFVTMLCIVTFPAYSAIIIFFSPSKSEADEDRKFILAIISFIFIVIMCTTDAVQN